MKAIKVAKESYRLEIGPEELNVLRFLAKFFIELDRTVFTGRFMRRVRRIHEALEEVQ
jgi:hypothetical protein